MITPAPGPLSEDPVAGLTATCGSALGGSVGVTAGTASLLFVLASCFFAVLGLLGVVVVGAAGTAGAVAVTGACALGLGAFVFVAPRAASSGIAYSFEDGPLSNVTCPNAAAGVRRASTAMADMRQR